MSNCKMNGKWFEKVHILNFLWISSDSSGCASDRKSPKQTSAVGRWVTRHTIPMTRVSSLDRSCPRPGPRVLFRMMGFWINFGSMNCLNIRLVLLEIDRHFLHENRQLFLDAFPMYSTNSRQQMITKTYMEEVAQWSEGLGATKG